LRIAARLGDLEMCRLLIYISKMDPLSALRRDDGGQMVLKEETSENEQNRFALLQLLRVHADAGSSSSIGHHPESKSYVHHLKRFNCTNSTPAIYQGGMRSRLRTPANKTWQTEVDIQAQFHVQLCDAGVSRA
jgi:hypothetical protein